MKQVITIIIIVAALAGAGVFAYLTFFSGTPTSTTQTSSGISESSEILPMGSNLNFDQVEKFNKDDRLYQYPIISPSEVGAVMGSIIKQ